MATSLSMHLKSCRCCAKLLKIGVKTIEITRSIEKRFFELSNVKLIMSDKYSKRICETCNSLLTEYWDFKNEIIEYQKNLYDYVETQEYDEEMEEEQIIVKEEVQAEDLVTITEMNFEDDESESDEDPFFERKKPATKKIKKKAKTEKKRWDANKSRLIRAKTLSEEGKLYRESVIGKHPTEEITSRGGIKLALNKYFYHKDRSRNNGEVMWRCSSRHRDNPCSAIIITTFHETTGLYTVVDIGKSPHSHPPYEKKRDSKIYREGFFNELKFW